MYVVADRLAAAGTDSCEQPILVADFQNQLNILRHAQDQVDVSSLARFRLRQLS
jgi:hypothetical protein